MRYEGFNNTILSVYVTEYIPQTEYNPPEKTLSILTNKANYRAFQIMACYVSIHLDRKKASPAGDDLLNSTLNEIISNGKIIYSSCNDESDCEASAEYDVKKLFDVIDNINNQ